MKSFASLLFAGLVTIGVLSGCSSSGEKLALDKKHAPLPDYVLNTSDKIQQTYIMASKYPEVLASVPCFCGCGVSDGHESNLDCYVKKMGDNNAVEEWDPMSIS